jgi:NAD(P)-dependent dehydrogenase (short-subunit alcohol dehydrogenase family)
MQDRHHSHRVALVTGAGSGIGRATALLLARQGWSLALLGRSRERLEVTAGACRTEGAHHTEVLENDLALPNTPGLAISRVDERFGRLDALVNNAGGGTRVPIHATTRSLLENTFAVNTFAPALLIATAWPTLERTARRHAGEFSPAIVNVSSMATIDPFPGLFIYAASKAALESYVRSIHNEEKSQTIRAFAVLPGAVETELLRAVFDEAVIPRSRTLPPEAVAEVIVDCILGRRDADEGGTIIVPSP